MTIDQQIADAIQKAVESSGQPRAVSERILAWFGALASGNERLEDPDSVQRRLEVLFEATMLDDAEEE